MKKEAVEISIIGTIKNIEMLGARALTVWPISVDARFVLVVLVEKAPKDSPFVVGKEVNLAIHSVAQTFFDPVEKYIWALATDSTGRLLVATGDPKGRVYRVAPTGAAEPLYTSSAAHVVSMTFDAERQLVVGTESPGRVFRIDADNRPFLLLDTNLQEVRALRPDGRGRIYGAAQARRPCRGTGSTCRFACPRCAVSTRTTSSSAS